MECENCENRQELKTSFNIFNSDNVIRQSEADNILRNKIIFFKDLKIGQKFECYGDINLNYNYPKICRCIKLDKNKAKEIDGISFLISENDKVFLINE